MDWDSRVDDVIEQSSQGLRQVSNEYRSHIIDEYNMRRQGSVSSSSSSRYSSAYQPQNTDDGTRIFRDVLNNIENQTPCGPHQRAALKAFHATTRRPLSRGTNRSSNVDRHIDEKLKSSSLAIDALRDQLVALSDEVRQLNRTKQLQEKRIESLVDIVRSIDNSQAVDNKASINDVDIAINKERQKMMIEINTLMEKQQQQISQSTQAFQRNLVDTIKQVVKEESAQTEKKCFDAVQKLKDDKGYVELITQIVTEASVEIESKLRADMSSKLEKALAEKRQQDTTLISRQVKEIMGSDLADIRRLLKQTAMKQASFIDTDKAEAMIQSCTSTLEEKVMDVLSTNNKDKDDALRSIEDSLSKHKSAIKHELDMISQTIITKQVADAIVTDRCDHVFDRCMKVINDSSTQFDNKMSTISSKLQACATNEDVIHLAHQQAALGESLTSSMEVVDRFESRLDELKHSFGGKMSTVLDVVEESDERSRQLRLKLNGREAFELQLKQSIEEIESKIESLQQNGVDESVLQKSSDLPILESPTDTTSNGNTVQQSSLKTPIKTSDDRPRELILSPDLSPKFNSFLDFISQPSADNSLTGLSSRQQQSPSSSRAPTTNTNDTADSEEKSGQLYEVPSSVGSSSNGSEPQESKEEQQSLTLERNRALSSLARTLSSVAIKNDDASLMEMATDIRAGKREEPNKDSRDGEGIKGSPSSAAEESIDTAAALSLCGVQLDQSSSRSDSPSTSVDDNSIDTADAISLCGGIQGQYEEDKETKSTNDKPTIDIKSSDGERDDNNNDDIEAETTSSGNTSTSLDSLNTTSSSSSSSDEEVPKKRSDSQYNPTRLSNPDPYQGWDTLLLELRASGKILRDGSSHSSSYSSNFSADE